MAWIRSQVGRACIQTETSALSISFSDFTALRCLKAAGLSSTLTALRCLPFSVMVIGIALVMLVGREIVGLVDARPFRKVGCAFQHEGGSVSALRLTLALDASTASNPRLRADTAIALGAARSCAAVGTGSAPRSSS